MKRSKRFLSCALAAIMMAAAAAVPAIAEESVSISKVAYIGSNEAASGWQTELTRVLGAAGTYTVAENMQEAMIGIPAIEKEAPELIVIDSSVAGKDEGEIFENVMLSIQSFATAPYVALVSESAKDASVGYVERLAANFDVDWICAEDAGSGSVADYVASELTYNAIDVPDYSKKISSFSYATRPVSQFSGKLTDESKSFTTKGGYVIVKTAASDGSYTVSLNGEAAETVSTVTNGVTYSKFRLGNREQTVELTATGTVEFTGVYSEPVDSVINWYNNFNEKNLDNVGAANLYRYTYEWVADKGIDNSGALHVENYRPNGDIGFFADLIEGKKYKVSAKMYLIAKPEEAPTVRLIIGGKDAGYAQSNLELGKWVDVSWTYTIPAGTAQRSGFGFRIGSNGGPANNNHTEYTTHYEYYIDNVMLEDLSVLPENVTKYYSADIDFEDKTTGIALLRNQNATYVENAGEDGGTVLQVPGASSEIIALNNLIMSPNRMYTISFKVKGISDNSIGKYIHTIRDRNGKYLRSNGAPASTTSGNYESLNNTQITNEWQTVTIKNRWFSPTSDYEGKCSIYFRLCNSNNINDAVSDNITIQFDDFKVTPENLFYGGDFETGVMFDAARYGSAQNIADAPATDGSANKALEWKINVAEAAWLYQSTALDPGKRYKLTFDCKVGALNGTNPTPKIETLLVYQSVAGDSGITASGRGFSYPGTVSVQNTEGWQTYSIEFVYNDEYGFKVAPQLQFRANGFTNGDILYLDNIGIEEIPFEHITNIRSSELTRGRKNTVSFDCNVGAKAYIYKIYSDTTVYSAGVINNKTVAFNNTAAYGQTLYADIQYVSEFGTYSKVYTQNLGKVVGAHFDASTGFNTTATDFYDGNVVGSAKIQNNGEDRTGEKALVLVIALYELDDSGNEIGLVSVKTSPCELEPYEYGEFTVSPYEVNSDLNLSAKVFLWDSLDTLQPKASASNMNNL